MIVIDQIGLRQAMEIKKKGHMTRGKPFSEYMQAYAGVVLIHYIYVLFFRLWEFAGAVPVGAATDVLNGLIGDVLVASSLLLILFLPFVAIARHSVKWAKLLSVAFAILFYAFLAPVQSHFIIQGSLADVLGNACAAGNTWFTVMSNLCFLCWLVPVILSLIVGVVYLYYFMIKGKFAYPGIYNKSLFIFMLVAFPVTLELGFNTDFLNKNSYRVSKPYYFAKTSFSCITGIGLPPGEDLRGIALFQSIRGKDSYLSHSSYPLLRYPARTEGMEQWFKPVDNQKSPDIVIIVVEGLYGHSSGADKTLTFSPFLDNLEQRSISWQNFLATSQLRQNAIPSLLGGLPFGKNGFTELPVVPYHFSLLSVLRHNGYHTSFYTGQWGWIKSFEKFMRFNDLGRMVDASAFPDHYPRVLVGEDDYFWGYRDGELFDYYLQHRFEGDDSPRVEVILSGSTRPPYAIANYRNYEQLFREKVNGLSDESDRAYYLANQDFYTALLYADEKLEEFFARYRQHPNYENTLFFITGNSPMAGRAAKGGLEKYRVPLMLYSPMIDESVVVNQVKSQNDVFESLLGFLSRNYGLDVPRYSASLGGSICDLKAETPLFVPFLGGDGRIREILLNDRFLSASRELFRVDKHLQLERLENKEKSDSLIAVLQAFLDVNSIARTRVIPDSLYFGFFDFNLIKDTVFSVVREREEFRDVVEQVSIGRGTHYVDIRLFDPDMLLEEVYLVYELRDAEGDLLQWENFGIPAGREDFSVRVLLDEHTREESPLTLQLFLWNQSSVPYSIGQVKATFYKGGASAN